ncbi:MAG: fibronectin type III domain-containing protein [Candidatus Thermoplasmatota archaeon]|nr:fibronectin type III domain-containing protein [Candidatus Thermoplasmatota archaeon]MBU1940743.1 fibronectin type III domain-containing protein [Candidatus Thermoplasmatota archaeon]
MLSVMLVPTIAAEVPGIPIGFNTTGRDGMVTLAWSEPEDDGGSDITGYRIYRGIMEDGLGIVEDVTDMTYTDTGLQNGQTYYYAVSALNAEGESEKTQILPATPQGDSPLITEIIVGEFENIHIIYVGEGVYFNLAGETYTVVVESVTDTTVTFFVDWGGIQSFTISEGDSENIDANGDGKDDFKITCKTITSDPAEGYPQTVKFSFTTKNLGGSSGGTPGFEVILVLIALSVALFWKRKRN